MQQVLGRRGQCRSRKMLLFQQHLPCSHIPSSEGYRAQIFVCSVCLVFCLFGFLGGGGHLCTSLSTQIPLLYLGSDSCLSSLLSASCCALRHCTMPDRSRQCHVSVFCSSLTLLSIMSPPKNSKPELILKKNIQPF